MEDEGVQKSESEQNSSNVFKVPTGVPLKNNKNKRKKRKNKSKKQKYLLGVTKPPVTRKNQKVTNAMTSWAETYTKAATWQYKHQIAYWKAKAKALEYENRVLHDIIRKNGMASTSSSEMSASEVSEATAECDSEMDEDIYEDDDDDDDPNLEVSEAFIEFLAANHKYKEDARLERERFKGLKNEDSLENQVKKMEAPPTKSPVEITEAMKELYGNSWQRISALETSLQCQFISDSDKYKPDYWPNIPFNFNYS